jgi:RNA polymerase sigma-70 factor, ECF subfamily
VSAPVPDGTGALRSPNPRERPNSCGFGLVRGYIIAPEIGAVAEGANVTSLLAEVRRGNPEALDALLPLVYAELRRIAARSMRRERGDHTLQPTALVNEAYLRLVDQRAKDWQNRAHFFAIAARIMRRVLLDHARRAGQPRRGGGARRVTLDDGEMFAGERSAELVALDDAMQRLAAVDERKCRIVELRFFGGLSVEETAEVLEVSITTVARDWAMARAWLRREMNAGGPDDA